ncbi:MAG: hypothetical protein ACYCYF_02620 [Anaerolineae bacterium]
MKKRHGVKVGLLVLALGTLLMAPAPLAAGTVIHFDAHQISPLEIISPPRMNNVSGGIIYAYDEAFVVCYRANNLEPQADYVTGCWYFGGYRYIFPDGRQLVYARSEQQDLMAFPNYEGYWVAQLAGEWQQDGADQIAIVDLTAYGCGALAGWTLVSEPLDAPAEMRERWHDSHWG